MNAIATTTEQKTAREIESDFQRLCSEFVGREVLACASTLIYELAQDEKYTEDLAPILSQFQYVHTFSYTCEQELDQDEPEECGETWEEEDEPRTDQWDRIRDVDDVEQFARACPECGTMTEPDDVSSSETDPIEAYEHWIVSSWLGRKLEEQGEMVTEFMNLTIWGRTCTGQAIAMDENIRALVRQYRSE